MYKIFCMYLKIIYIFPTWKCPKADCMCLSMKARVFNPETEANVTDPVTRKPLKQLNTQSLKLTPKDILIVQTR